MIPVEKPYCGNCGYDFTGLVDATRCPECGRPIIEVLTRKTFVRQYWIRYTSRAELLGVPVIDIALSNNRSGRPKVARGIIAIGNFAVGGVAIGAITGGVVNISAIGFGGWVLSSVGVGLFGAVGAVAIGLLAAGNLVIGVLANGLVAVGVYAQGTVVSGWVAHSYGSNRGQRAPVSGPVLYNRMGQFEWFFGHSASMPSILQSGLVVLAGSLLTAGVIGVFAYVAWRRNPGRRDSL